MSGPLYDFPRLSGRLSDYSACVMVHGYLSIGTDGAPGYSISGTDLQKALALNQTTCFSFMPRHSVARVKALPNYP